MPSHWRKRVLASGPASESLVRRFSQVSPNFDPSLWIKGPQFSRSTGFGLWFPGLAEGTGIWSAPVVSAVIREELRRYFCLQWLRGKGGLCHCFWEGQGGLDPYHYCQAVWLWPEQGMREVWGTEKGESALFGPPPAPSSRRGSRATQAPVWLPPVISYILPTDLRSRPGPSFLSQQRTVGTGHCGELFLPLKLTPGPLEGQKGQSGEPWPCISWKPACPRPRGAIFSARLKK